MAKDNIKNLIDTLFSIQFDDLKEENNYIELLEMCKKVEGLPSHKWLMVVLCELILIENNKLKQNFEEKEKNSLKFFDYCLKKKKYLNTSYQEEFSKYIDSNNYFNIFKKAKILTNKDITIIAFIAKVKEDFTILFQCIDNVYSLKEPFYVLTKKELKFENKFKVYLEQLNDFFEYNDFENNKEYFSLEYNDKDEIHFQYYNEEEFYSIKKENIDKIKPKDIKKYILSNSIIKDNKQNTVNKIDSSNINLNNLVPEKKENIEEIKIKEINKKESTNKKEVDKMEEEVEPPMTSEQETLLKYLENKLKKDYENKINEQKKDFENKICQQKKDFENKICQQKKDFENKILDYESKIMDYENKINECEKKIVVETTNRDNAIRRIKKNHQYEINNLNNQHSKLMKFFNIYKEKEKENYNKMKKKYIEFKLLNIILKKENKDKDIKMQNISDEKIALDIDMDTIKSRALSKGIIDFFSFVFDNFNYDQSYRQKKENIISKINNEIKENKLDADLLLNLINFINRIYKLKVDGDGYAHTPVDLKCLFELIGDGCESIINILNKLDLYKMLKKFNELYKTKSQENDCTSIEEEIALILPDKKDNFLMLIKKN